jgi:hypothetical protein
MEIPEVKMDEEVDNSKKRKKHGGRWEEGGRKVGGRGEEGGRKDGE